VRSASLHTPYRKSGVDLATPIIPTFDWHISGYSL
jgi:hypothetical protein